jgi:N-acyl homoserine lactone hydrolase
VSGPLFSLSAAAQEVTLTRLDCGSGSNDPRRFRDTFAYTETTKPFTFSCYVVRHGSDVMVWETGYLPGSVPSATNKPLADLLNQINVNPDDVKFVGISHFHADHTGQLGRSGTQPCLSARAIGTASPPARRWAVRT